MGTPHPPPRHERHPGESASAESRVPAGATGDGTTSLEALTTALDRLVLSRILTTEQARAVLRELALPIPPERPPTLSPPPIALIGEPGPTSGPEVAPSARTLLAGAPLPPDVVATTGPETDLTAVPEQDAGTERRHTWINLFGEVGGYLGATFVLGGFVELAGPGWETLTRAERLLVLAGPAIALLLAALLLGATVPGGWTVRPEQGPSARRRLISSLVTLAALLSAAAVDQVATGRNALLATAGTATLVCAIGYVLCRGTVLHLWLGLTTAWTLCEVLDRAGVRGTGIAWGFVLAAVLWVMLVMARVLSEWTLGVVVAGTLGCCGGEALTLGRNPPLGYLVVGALAVGGLAGYLWTRRVAVLVVGVVALATVIPETVTHYAHGALRAGGALLVTGLSIIGASVLGLLLHRRPPAHRAEPG
jgi:hypothetical protein